MSDSPVQPKKVTAILVVAAGRGRRFGSDVPKQYLPISGICAFRRCLDTFLDLPEVSCIQTVIHRDDQKAYAQANEGLNDSRLLPASYGCETRVEAVLKGLKA
jgi:2-C-methyl-D-erythritol 4-phosphate cytidylyltransferase